MVQRLRALAVQVKDLSFNIHPPQRNLGVVVHVCNHSTTVGATQDDPWDLQAAPTIPRYRFSEILSQENKAEGDRAGQQTSSSGLVRVSH